MSIPLSGVMAHTGEPNASLVSFSSLYYEIINIDTQKHRFYLSIISRGNRGQIDYGYVNLVFYVEKLLCVLECISEGYNYNRLHMEGILV